MQKKNNQNSKNALPTIVFLPGVLNTADLFSEQQAFLQHTFTIYHADTYNFNCLLKMARNVLDTTTGDLILIGLSMGGYCALEMYNQCPDRIKGLVLFNSSATPPAYGNIMLRKKLIHKALNAKEKFVGTTNAVLDMILGSQNRHNQNIRARLRRMGDALNYDVYVRQQTAIINRPDPRPGIVNSAVPSLFIVGQEDVLVPPEDLEMIARSKKYAQYYVLEGAGHMCPLEFPEKCEKILKQWLNTHFNVDL